ncbi:MAG: carbohydrate porin [Bacteroidota bacterium]
MKKYVYTLLLVVPLSIFGQDSITNILKGFSTGGGIYVDGIYNFSGGIEEGFGYAAMGLAEVSWNSDDAELWKGTELFFTITPLAGSAPSDNLTGDFQGISNIDAGGNYVCFQELWIRHTFPFFSISAGLHDANALFAVSEHGSLFLNGSFGIPSLIAENAVAPLFPLTALGVQLEIPLGNYLSFNSAVYDGKPTNLEDNPHNLTWSLSPEDGALFMNELVLNQENGFQKFGFFYHSGTSVYNESTELYDTLFEHNYGFYSNLDQEMWKNNDNSKSISTFVQLAVSPQKLNEHTTYVGGGIVFDGFDPQQKTVFGLAVAYAQCTTHSISETVIELSYAYQITEHISLQPDVQYVINESASNPFVGMMRCSVEF